MNNADIESFACPSRWVVGMAKNRVVANYGLEFRTLWNRVKEAKVINQTVPADGSTRDYYRWHKLV